MVNEQYFGDLEQQVSHALLEDIGAADITAELIEQDTSVTAEVITRQPAMLCGQAWVNEVFNQIDASLAIDWLAAEGTLVQPNQLLLRISGQARSILTAERTALNFLQTLSGTATTTHRYAQLIKHTRAKLLDTRKTIPGLRRAQKYAVKCGGGENHRMGLYDAFLIKENHILACGSITAAIAKAKQLYPGKRIEVEVENLAEFQEAIAAEPDWIMLDNFSLADMATAVGDTSRKAKLEASGGIEDDQSLIAIAETGVDYISMGALTKHCSAIDLSLRIRN